MNDEDLELDHEYEWTAKFWSQYSGYCTLNPDHRFKKGELVAKIQKADNPFITITGVACKHCLLDIPKAQ